MSNQPFSPGEGHDVTRHHPPDSLMSPEVPSVPALALSGLVFSSTVQEHDSFLPHLYGAIATSVFVLAPLNDQHLNYVALDRRYAQAMGKTAETVVGRSLDQVFGSIWAAVMQQRWAACVDLGQAIAYEEGFPLDQPVTWWLTTLTPLPLADGQGPQVVGTSTNITQLKQAELDLRSCLQSLNLQLEVEMRQQTVQLQKAIQFEESVRRITEKVRDSLDERQILEAVTQELARVLKLNRCKVELYDWGQRTATIAYEYTTNQQLCQREVRRIDDFPDIYGQLVQRSPVQFGEWETFWNMQLPNVTRLACPIFDDQEVLGNLWLLRPAGQSFEDFEIRLVQQVANECAIAIRQARLYQTAQAQVAELEKLIRVKDEFLTSISHELRTPISSIFLAAQTLEKLLRHKGMLDADDTIARSLKLLQHECQRETRLINNLLVLSYADHGEILNPTAIDLRDWLAQIVEPFRLRIHNQQQQLVVQVERDMPPLKCDRAYLERILNELLNNACKYTPPNETIAVTATTTPATLEIGVHNSGIEIPTSELTQIFEKFYRLPDQDVWELGGAGLGLAVVKKLSERLEATIRVTSREGQTSFILEFLLSSTPLETTL